MKGCGALVIAACVLIASCGDSPTPPTTTLNLAGAWTGTWTFTSGGAMVTDTVTMTVSQTGTSAVGQWSSTSGAAGTVTFTATEEFTGSAGLSQTLIIGGNCTASTTLTGTASMNQIKFTLGALTPTGLCQWAPSNQFTFTR